MEAVVGKMPGDPGTFLFGPIMLAVFIGVGLYFDIVGVDSAVAALLMGEAGYDEFNKPKGREQTAYVPFLQAFDDGICQPLMASMAKIRKEKEKNMTGQERRGRGTFPHFRVFHSLHAGFPHFLHRVFHNRGRRAEAGSGRLRRRGRRARSAAT